jgi:hypothetical protein
MVSNFTSFGGSSSPKLKPVTVLLGVRIRNYRASSVSRPMRRVRRLRRNYMCDFHLASHASQASDHYLLSDASVPLLSTIVRLY